LSGAPAAGADELTGNIAWTTDYRFRGESLSNRLPAVQGGLDFGHSSGLFAGVFASSVRLPRTNTRMVAQFYGGYVHELSEGLTAEAGVVRYDYWRSALPYADDYTEGFVGVAAERWSMRLYGTPNYAGSGAAAGYLEAAVSRELLPRVHGSLHAGFLFSGPSDYYYSEYYKTRRLDVRAGVAADFSWVQAEVAVVAVAASHGDCANGTHRCSPGVVLTLRHGF